MYHLISYGIIAVSYRNYNTFNGCLHSLQILALGSFPLKHCLHNNDSFFSNMAWIKASGHKNTEYNIHPSTFLPFLIAIKAGTKGSRRRNSITEKEYSTFIPVACPYISNPVVHRIRNWYRCIPAIFLFPDCSIYYSPPYRLYISNIQSLLY